MVERSDGSSSEVVALSPDEMAERFQDPDLAQGMQYVQASLADGLKRG